MIVSILVKAPSPGFLGGEGRGFYRMNRTYGRCAGAVHMFQTRCSAEPIFCMIHLLSGVPLFRGVEGGLFFFHLSTLPYGGVRGETPVPLFSGVFPHVGGGVGLRLRHLGNYAEGRKVRTRGLPRAQRGKFVSYAYAVCLRHNSDYVVCRYWHGLHAHAGGSVTAPAGVTASQWSNVVNHRCARGSRVDCVDN